MEINIAPLSAIAPGKVFRIFSDVFGYNMSSTEKANFNQNIMFTGRHVFKKDYEGEELYDFCRIKTPNTDSFQLISSYAKAEKNPDSSAADENNEYIYEKFEISADGTYKSLGYYTDTWTDRMIDGIIIAVDEVSKFSVEELQTLAKIFSMEFPFYI